MKWLDIVKQMTGRPNEEDAEKAKALAKKSFSKMIILKN